MFRLGIFPMSIGINPIYTAETLHEDPEEVMMEPTPSPPSNTVSLKHFGNIHAKTQTIREFTEIYGNNMRVALNIIRKFKRFSNILLYAQMQSGKTITYNLVLYAMFQLKIIKRVYIICGMNDNDLKYQAHQDAEAHNPMFSQHISVHFNKDLPLLANRINRYPELKHKTLFIIDESHYGASKGQQLDKFFRDINAPVNKPLPDKLYILSVSATPYAQLMLNLSHNADNTVYLETAPSYIGINDFYAADRFKTTFDPIRKSMEFVHLIKSYGNKYGLVRALKIEDELRMLCEAHDIRVISYDSDGDITTLEELNDILAIKPTKPTIFILKHKLRAGCVIKHKQHIGFIWENAATPNTDTILQGLIGRMCGYNSNLDVDIYAYPELLNGELAAAIKSFQSLQTVPLKCNHISKPKAAVIHGTFPTQVFMVDGAEYGFNGRTEPDKHDILDIIRHNIDTFNLKPEQKEFILHKISQGITRDVITSRAFKSSQYKNEYPMYLESINTRTPYTGHHGIDETEVSAIVVASVYHGYEFLDTKYHGKMFIIFRLPTDAPPPPTVSVKSMYHPEDVIPADMAGHIFDTLKQNISRMIEAHETTLTCSIPFDTPINNQTKELITLLREYRPHKVSLRFRTGRRPTNSPISEIRNITITY
jgi:hypothetical protein